jgi:transcriptional regulator with XRE-family HTH domain
VTATRKIPFHSRLRAARRRGEITQTDLAAQIGYARESVSRFEAGDPRYQTAALTRAIADALGMKVPK